MTRQSVAVVLCAALLVACASRQASPPEAWPDARSDEARLDAIVSALQTKAREAEPRITAKVLSLADEFDGTVTGLEHRFKTAESIHRKILTLLEHAPGRTLDTIVINDALRYTMIVDDDPPGTHNETVSRILLELEADGYPIVEVKNYWPPGDTYAGINSVLDSSRGLQWELQFHTPASFAARTGGHDLYERLRLDTTPDGEKRRLYDDLTELWDAVPIPEGILEPGSLHPREELLARPPPPD